MNGAVTCEYDVRQLSQLMGSLKAAVMGNGATTGDCQDMLKTEAGLLAWDISEQLGPKTLAQGQAGITKDAKKVFFPVRNSIDWFEGTHKEGPHEDFKWLFATKRGPGMLIGANAEDILANADAGTLTKMFYEADRKRGAIWQDMGYYSHHAADSTGRKRPHFRRMKNSAQHAVRINRVVISESNFALLVKEVSKKLGQLRATFAATTVALGLKKRVPEWVMRQVAAVRGNGKSIFNDAGLRHPTEPFIEFGSRAAGVVNNPYIADKIHRGIEKSRFRIAAKLRKVINGYTYQFKTGQCYKQPAITGVEDL